MSMKRKTKVDYGLQIRHGDKGRTHREMNLTGAEGKEQTAWLTCYTNKQPHPT